MAQYMKHMPEKIPVDTSTMIIAPMPGLVKNVAVEVGQSVSTSSNILPCLNYNYEIYIV